MDVEKAESSETCPPAAPAGRPVGYSPAWFERHEVEVLGETLATADADEWPLMLLDSAAYVTTDNHAAVATDVAEEIMGWTLDDEGWWVQEGKRTKYSAVGVRGRFPWAPTVDVAQAWFAASVANARFGIDCNITNVAVTCHYNTSTHPVASVGGDGIGAVMLCVVRHQSVQPSFELTLALLLATRALQSKMPSAAPLDAEWLQHVQEATATCIPCNPFLFMDDPYPAPPPEGAGQDTESLLK